MSIIDRRTPTEKILAHDAEVVETTAGGRIDVAMVLGTGLSSIVGGAFAFTAIPYDRMLGMPVTSLEGHAGEALIGTWHNKRVLIFAGRAHLYQGFSPQQVTTNVRLAHAAGARAIVLTNASGSVDPSYAPGDVMLIADQINLTGRNPLIGVTTANPFVDMSDAYSERLRELAKRMAKPGLPLREGVYAGLLGPSFETPAEVRFLRAAGAHALGMSTVLEAIYARSLGMEILGASIIANVAGVRTAHGSILAAPSAGGTRLAKLIDTLFPHI